MSETTFCLTPYAISHMPTARRCPSIFVVGGERLRPTSPLFVRLALGDLTYLRGACPRRGSDGVRLPVALRAPLDIDTRMFWGFLERSGKKAQNRRVSITSAGEGVPRASAPDDAKSRQTLGGLVRAVAPQPAYGRRGARSGKGCGTAMPPSRSNAILVRSPKGYQRHFSTAIEGSIWGTSHTSSRHSAERMS